MLKMVSQNQQMINHFLQINSCLWPDHADVLHACFTRWVRSVLVVHGHSVKQLCDELVGQPALHQQLHRH